MTQTSDDALFRECYTRCVAAMSGAAFGKFIEQLNMDSRIHGNLSESTISTWQGVQRLIVQEAEQIAIAAVQQRTQTDSPELRTEQSHDQ